MTIKKSINVWLFSGLVMIFVQIFIGGVTRLTGSGLSITKWEIITGTLPPLTQSKWEAEFEKYKVTPQYLKINQGMSLQEFKFIYFWEYFHRLWARLMGLVFVIPFLYFWSKKAIDNQLMRRLMIVILLAVLVASFGWVMVASGLINRPWVNAYKLTMHLALALVLFGYLLWVYFQKAYASIISKQKPATIKLARSLIVILGIQILLGGIMSGMKAGLSYPTWPDMNGELIPSDIMKVDAWSKSTFIEYDANHYMAMIVQFFHRAVAYIFGLVVLFYSIKYIGSVSHYFRRNLYWIFGLTFVQIVLGIFTVINCHGSIPLWLGVLHQAFAIFLLTAVLFINFQIRVDK